MSDDAIHWGGGASGVRLGLRAPRSSFESGGTISIELLLENRSPTPTWVFGFEPRYPRSLRVSPPKPNRPWIRVSFGDVNVLHPPEAFTRIEPGARVSSQLDLSFAFDGRGAGEFPLLFVYDPVRAAGSMRVFQPPDEGSATTGRATLVVTRPRSAEEAGITLALEDHLEASLLRGDPSLVDELRTLGPGGARFLARRVGRVLSHGLDAVVGWRALDTLEALGPSSIAAIEAVLPDQPHAQSALAFAHDWLDFRAGRPTPPEHLPFVSALELLRHQPDRRGNFVLSWTPHDSLVHGSTRMEIFGNGDRIVVVRPAGASVPSTRRTLLSPAHMQGLFDVLGYSGVWLLRPLRRDGLPDEPRPALELQLELGSRYAHRIAMWNGEWRGGPGFRLADLLDRLVAQVHVDSLLPPHR